MSLSAKVTAAVDKAFAAAGDIVKLGTLSTKLVSSYDFSSRQTVSTTSSQTVEVIIQSTQRPSGEGFTTTAIMKSGVDISVYDILIVGSKTYNIVDYTDNNFTIEAILTKEVQ
jgi:hypothetical protein